MIRVLKNADFSNCGLGHVEIPVPQTDEANVAVGWFPYLTDEQETKLKRFIDKLVYHRIYQKLTYLAVPYLAVSLQESVNNILLGEGAVQPSANENMNFTEEHGLYFTSTTGGNFNLKPSWKSGVGGEVGEYSMGVCVEFKGTWDKNNIGGPYMQRRPSYTKGFGQIKPSFSSTPGVFAGLSSDAGGYVSWIYDNSTGIQILSCGTNEEDEELEALALGSNGIVASLDTTSFNDNNNGVPYGTYIGGNNGTSYPYCYYRLFFDGEHLTSGEMAIMRDEIKTLCDWE